MEFIFSGFIANGNAINIFSITVNLGDPWEY